LQNIELEKGQFLVMTIGMEEKKSFGGREGVCPKYFAFSFPF
jgi:hypothetical protein